MTPTPGTASVRRLAALGLALVLALSAGPAQADGQPHPPLKKLRALLVIETSHVELASSVDTDRQSMEQLLRQNIPPDRLTLDKRTGPEATHDAILNYYRDLRTGPDEALLFYYAGHGATDPLQGPYFVLQVRNNKPTQKLLRVQLVKVMESKGAGLVVLLTDCCSNVMLAPNRKVAKKDAAPKAPALPRSKDATLAGLLLRHRGRIDLTAATNDEAMGDPFEGGCFTRAFRDVVGRPVAELDRNRDGFVSWSEVFPILDRTTDQILNKDLKQQGARFVRPGGGKGKPPTSQHPRAYQLPDDGVQPAPGRALVSLRNPSPESVRYRYRWADRSEWTEATLMAKGSAGDRTVIQRKLNPGEEPAELVVETVGEAGTQTLKPHHWTGIGEPDYHSSGECKYQLLAKKFAGSK